MLVAVEGMVRGSKRVGCMPTESADAPISQPRRRDLQNVLATFEGERG